MTILFFGDSITWGAWDKEGGWVARIKRAIDQKVISTNFRYYHELYNVGISGDNTDDLLVRFEDETKHRIDQGEEVVFVFAIGVNDSQFVKGEGHRVSLTKFGDNTRSLIGKARKWSNKILFVGLFPIDDSRTNPYEENKTYKLEFVSKFNQKIRDVCLKEDVDFIDIYNEFVNKNYRELLIDGLHPNSEGHRQISVTIFKYLKGKKYM